jgi:hypothetical protein
VYETQMTTDHGPPTKDNYSQTKADSNLELMLCSHMILIDAFLLVDNNP